MNQAHFLNKRLKLSRIPTLNQESARSSASGSSLQPAAPPRLQLLTVTLNSSYFLDFFTSPQRSLLPPSSGSVEQKLQAHKDVSAAEVSVQRSAWRLFHVSDGTFNSFCFIPSFSFHHRNVFTLFSKTMCFLFCSLALQV